MLMTKRYAVVVETHHITTKTTFRIKRYDDRRSALIELDRLEDKYWNSFYNRVYMVDTINETNVLLPT